MPKMQCRRGLKSKLPILADGEFGFCTDTKELFIGVSGTNVLVNKEITELDASKIKSGTMSPARILPDANNRFVTDSEKSTWNGKANLASPTFTGTPSLPTGTTGVTQTSTNNSTRLATTAFVKSQAYATLASPTFTGTPKAPTPVSTDDSTNIATTAFVKGQLSAFGGKKYATIVIGHENSGHTIDQVDYLCTGTNDHTMINDAIAALPSDGGEVLLLEGTYNCGATATINKNNVKIRGMGSSTIIKRMFRSSLATVNPVISISGDNAILQSLCFDGNRSEYLGSAVVTGPSCKYTTIKDCEFVNNKQFGFYTRVYPIIRKLSHFSQIIIEAK